MICLICNEIPKCGFSAKYLNDSVCVNCEVNIQHPIALKRQYYENHKACPKCGGLSYISTMMGFIFDSENPDSFKDENDCVCNKCGDRHTCHERVPLSKSS